MKIMQSYKKKNTLYEKKNENHRHFPVPAIKMSFLRMHFFVVCMRLDCIPGLIPFQGQKTPSSDVLSLFWSPESPG
jgi:hypothetical protein